jgi:hypothetical protein
LALVWITKMNFIEKLMPNLNQERYQFSKNLILLLLY